MRFFNSWPIATLLLGIAALMGLNAATPDGPPAEYPDAAQEPADSASFGWQSVESAEVLPPVEPTNALSTGDSRAPAPIAASSGMNPAASTYQVAGADSAGAVAGAQSCQELSSVTQAVNPYGFAGQVATSGYTPSGVATYTWRGSTPPAAPAREQDRAYEVFGPHAAIVKHLVQVHEELGELRGEASLRESVIAMTAENAAMMVQLESVKGRQELMQQLMAQHVEIARLQADKQALEAAESHHAEQAAEWETEVEVEHYGAAAASWFAIDAASQQARIEELRNENDSLRTQLETIRGQLEAISKPIAEPSVNSLRTVAEPLPPLK